MPRLHVAPPDHARIEDRLSKELAALYAVIVEEINILRASAGLPLRTEGEARTRLAAMQQCLRTTRTTEGSQ